MNTPIDSASIATATTTVREAAAGSSTLSKAKAVTAKANVARKTPKAVLVIAERTNVRMTRGDSCALASWRATSVIAKTTPTKVSIEDAITCSSAFAVLGRATLPSPQSSGRPNSSGAETTTPISTPATISARGIDQNRSRTHSAHRTGWCAHRDPAGSARTGAAESTSGAGISSDARDGPPYRFGRGVRGE